MDIPSQKVVQQEILQRMPPLYLRFLIFCHMMLSWIVQSLASHQLRRHTEKQKDLREKMQGQHLMMRWAGSSKPRNPNHHSSVIANDEMPDDCRAMWIQFKGREWIIFHYGTTFTAYPSDNNPTDSKEVQRLYKYMRQEGFILDQDKPNA